jgi:RND family efflux transporter MFP subunit
MFTKKIMKPLISMTLIFTFLFLSGCSKDDDAKNSNSEKDNAIPVVIKKVEGQKFTKSLSYFTQLRGVKETTEGAAIGGRIEKINYEVGSRVKKDDIIIEFPDDSPASQYRQAETAFNNSLKNYERTKVLLNAGEKSQANFDAVEAKYLVDKSNYETQHKMIFIKAPYDGIITGMTVNEGDNVKAKDPLFSIANLNQITCKIWAPAEEIKTN